MTVRFRSLQFWVLIVGVMLLSGCAETQLVSHLAKKVTWPGQEEGRGTYKVGKPYKVGSVWYYPEENFQLVETGIASWYGPGFHEDHTANGEIFNQNEMTAAHRTLQLPSIVRVTNLENGRSVVVRVNDRGPFKHGRIMDVSMRAAEQLGFANKGTARVRLEVMQKESRTLAEAAKRGEDTTRMTLADLSRGVAAQPKTAVAAPVPATPQPVRSASLAGDAETLPESLRTPTITVETLNGEAFVSQDITAPPPVASPVALRTQAAVHMNAPPVVSTRSVVPTALFVQAGSFSVYANAERLTKQLVNIAPAVIEPVTINSRKMYRVKLGPIADVAAADSVLEKVIRAGQETAKVVKADK